MSPYSLGDAIDWKLDAAAQYLSFSYQPLLARGRDRLETPYNVQLRSDTINVSNPYSLGDAIDWKLLSVCSSTNR